MESLMAFLIALIWPAFIIVLLIIGRKWVEDLVRVVRNRIEKGSGISLEMGGGRLTLKEAVRRVDEKQHALAEQSDRIEATANRSESTLHSLTSLLLVPPAPESWYRRQVEERIRERRSIRIGCRMFTEQRILCALLATILRRQGRYAEVVPRYDYGGAMESFVGLARGDIDLTPEYTWTGFEIGFDTSLGAVTSELNPLDADEALEQLNQLYGDAPFPLHWLAPLGFENNWEMLMSTGKAESKGIQTISDLASHPNEYVLGCEKEFFARTEAFGVLTAAPPSGYDCTFRDVEFYPRSEIYRALSDEKVDLINGFSTDPQIDAPDLVRLRDDERRFGRYHAAIAVRQDVLEIDPFLRETLESLAGLITPAEMGRLIQKADELGKEAMLKQLAVEGIAKRFLDRKKFEPLSPSLSASRTEST